VKEVEHSWHTNHESFQPEGMFRPNNALSLFSFQRWRNNEKGKYLKQVKIRPGVSTYLYSDSKGLAMFRARLRFNVAFNHEFFRRNLRLASSPDCSHCPGVPETRDHVLLHCPLFDHARYNCELLLSRSNLPLSLPVLLGGVDDLPAAQRKAALEASTNFLMSILSARASV
jgi:hypothetical protein